MAPPPMKKRDMVYLLYFLIHIPVMFLVDLYPLYPIFIIPDFMSDLRTWYIVTYHDLFFVSPPPFFVFFAWLELLFHVPVAFWSVGGLWRGDDKVPVVLLAYAMQTAITTGTCIFDFLTWDTGVEVKGNLLGLYGPYLAVSVFMGLDMYKRLCHVVGGLEKKKKV
ncbi:membrane protein SPAC56F8.07 [Phlyctema vagabunda]|uniref:Efficient mitochondria targeting-associated protein 19 n=1 Tax=Phlyctema vagabunda TaxID=108571 RepID=A0ABR4PYL5_9HELO